MNKEFYPITNTLDGFIIVYSKTIFICKYVTIAISITKCNYPFACPLVPYMASANSSAGKPVKSLKLSTK